MTNNWVARKPGKIAPFRPASILDLHGVAFDQSTGKLHITIPNAVMVATLPN